MEWFTEVKARQSDFKIEPEHRLLFVGSCFADSIGRQFAARKFAAEVNPYGVMYNPVSILHTLRRTNFTPDVAVLTLGTNHVYRLKETGEIVDNCQKRPQRLFDEIVLDTDECVRAICECAETLLCRNAATRIVLTVSPIRYAKYGFHGSRLSKAALLLAADVACKRYPARVDYFPAYEIMNDELRDYRFYKPDMLHPSEQAVELIFARFADAYFSPRCREYLADMAPILAALGHRPFRPGSEETLLFMEQTRQKAEAAAKKWPHLAATGLMEAFGGSTTE